MKYQIKIEEFQPITVTITLENKDELLDFAGRLNLHSKTVQELNSIFFKR